MIKIELSDNWDLLRQVPDQLDDFVRRAPKLAAEQYETDIHDWINAGKAFKPRSGVLAQSIGWRPEGNSALIYANARYARYVEQGTGKYVGRSGWTIKPKSSNRRKALKLPAPGGGYQFRKSVFHPGSRPFPFFFTDFDNRVDLITKELFTEFAEVLFK